MPCVRQPSKIVSLAVLTKLKCAAGLAELATRKYKSAARYFIQTNFDHCDFPDVSSATCAGIGGLAGHALSHCDDFGKDNAILINASAILENDNAVLENNNAVLENDNVVLQNDNAI